MVEFHKLCPEGSPDYDDILAFFKKIIKTKKREMGDGGDGDDDDDDGDEVDDDEDDEENEFNTKFNQEEHKIDEIERLRDSRIELHTEKTRIEADIAKLEDNRKKLERNESETKKELEDTEDMIQEFQKEKMDKLNQLTVSILLKISQIQNLEMNADEYEKWKKYREENQPEEELNYDSPGLHGYGGSPTRGGNTTNKGRDANAMNHFGHEVHQPIEEDYRGYFLPNDLEQTTLFSHEQLLRLIDRKRELDEETQKNKETEKKQKELEKSINKKIKVNQALKKEKEEEYNEKQMLRFGDIVDLDSLEVSGPSQVVLDLRNQQLKVEKLCMKRREEAEADLEQTQRELTRAVKENTGLLELIIDLGKQQIEANEKLDMTKQAILEDENAETKKQIIKDKEELRECIKVQSRRIETLKTEINLYKRKGGHIYTKVTTNRRHANMRNEE